MIKQNAIFSFHHEKISYAKYIQTFVGLERAHFYVIDLSEETMREKILKARLLTEEGFQEFSSEILCPIFFKTKEPLRYNLYLIFLLPDEMELTSEMWKLKEEFQYMRKLFLKASLFSKFLSEEHKKETCFRILIGNEKYKFGNFNILFNPDSLKNLAFLKSLSEALKSPIYDIGFVSDEAIQNIQYVDQKKLTYFYQKLWSMFQESEVPKNLYRLSKAEKECFYLASILSNQMKGKPLLLNGIFFKTLDDIRRLNFISTLSDFSEQSGSIILTCERENDISLIKKKVYRANFIDPNNRNSKSD